MKIRYLTKDLTLPMGVKPNEVPAKIEIIENVYGTPLWAARFTRPYDDTKRGYSWPTEERRDAVCMTRKECVETIREYRQFNPAKIEYWREQ